MKVFAGAGYMHIVHVKKEGPIALAWAFEKDLRTFTSEVIDRLSSLTFNATRPPLESAR